MSNSDDTNELDNYGVWVKKPPKDIPVDDSEIMDDSFTLDSDLPDFSSLDSEISVDETTEANTDAPAGDFDISVDGITEESLEDPFADVDFGDTAVEEPAVEETDAETPAVEEDDFNLDDVTSDLSLDDINFDIDTDLNTEETAVTEETSETAAEEPALDDFNVEGIAETSSETTEENFDFEIDENPGAEIITDAGEITIDEIEDGEVDLDNFLGDSSESSDAGDSVDVSADFGLEEGSTDSVDLGDFLGDGDLSDFGADSKPKAETIEDQDPLNIDLSFDESANSFATEDTEESEASGSDETSSEDRSTGESIDTESIDISDFGIGEEESGFTGPEDAINEEKQEVVDYDMKVTADSDDDVTVSMDDVISGNVESDTSSEEIEETPVTSDEEPESNEISAKGQEILQQIVGELASLKDEIKNLKTDFAEIKNHGTDFEIKEEENTGFFSDGDEDDTIALSGDELSNILNNAEFLDESAQEEEETSVDEQIIEEDVSDETTVSNGQFEATIDDNAFNDESIFDEHADEDIQNATSEISEDLPDEIEIPKLDDESEEITPSDFSSTIEEDPIDNILAEDAPISDALTDDKIDYISEDSNNPVEEDELADLDLPAPTLDDAFEQESNVDEFKAENEMSFEEEPAVAETSDEPVIEETSVEEPSLDDDSLIFEESTEAPVVSNEEITGDLKSEIKSVLSYMDQLLENLPEDKISEFAQSEHFVTYKKLFQELGLS